MKRLLIFSVISTLLATIAYGSSKQRGIEKEVAKIEATPASRGAHRDTQKIRPISWKIVDNDGSYTNLEYAYDNNATTKAEIKSPAGKGEETAVYQSIAYIFNFPPRETSGTLYYTWLTKIGRGCCWNGDVKIFYWNWGKSEWDEICFYEDQELTTQTVNIDFTYIEEGNFQVKFASKSGCSPGDRFATIIELYDLYCTSEVSEVPPKLPSKQSKSGTAKNNYLPIGIGLLGSIVLVWTSLKRRLVTSLKNMLKIIKSALASKLSLTVGMISSITYTAAYLLLGNRIEYSEETLSGKRWLFNISTSDFLSLVFLAILVGVVMALFAYTIKKYGFYKSKQAGVGFGGVLIALVGSFSACCGPILVSLIGVGASMFLARYRGLFLAISIIILVLGTILIVRTIEKEEEGVCCRPEVS